VRRFLGRRPTLYEDGTSFDYLVEWVGDSPSWQQDSRLQHLRWAVTELERAAREQLQRRRLSRHDTIILPGHEATATRASANEQTLAHEDVCFAEGGADVKADD